MAHARRLIPAALLALLTLLWLVGSPAAVAPARALTTDASIDVVIDELAPLVPRAASTLVVTGRVVNVTPRAIEQVSVRLRTSTGPVADRSLVDEIASAPLNPDAPYDNRYFDRTRDSIGVLAPGEQADFAIRIPMRELRLRGSGAYVVSVEALGRDPGVDEFEARQGIQRTFVPWFPATQPVRPVALTWLWPLADWPARSPDGAFLNDRTPNELSADGRLRQLVDIGASHASAVTWVADPQLLQSAAAIARGYRVQRDGVPVVGDRSPQASTWLTALERAVRGSTLHVLPYADVDAVAARRAGLSDDVVRSVTTAVPVSRQAVDSTVRGELAWAPDGRYDKQTANLLATAGVRTVVLGADAMPLADDAERTTTPNGIADYGTAIGPIDAVLIDQPLQRTLSLPQSTAAQVLDARQRFLAHTAVIAQQDDGTAGARVIAVAPADLRWNPDRRLVMPLLRATQAAPWLRTATLDRLLRAPREPRTRAAYGEQERRGELPPRYLERVVKSQARVDSLVSVLVDPVAVAPAFGSALLRTQSSAWRSELRTGEQLVTSVNREVAARTGAVRALSSGTVTFSGDSGRVPVTIANDGTDSVSIGVQLIGEPASRLSSTPHEPIEIEPGRKASIDLEARVIGGDPLTVRVQLLTPDGEPFGDAETITLGSTAYARAAAWVVGLAFAAIAIFVIVGVTRRIAKARRIDRGAKATRADETVSP